MGNRFRFLSPEKGKPRKELTSGSTEEEALEKNIWLKRMSAGFMEYQKLLEKSDDPTEKEHIQMRMWELWDSLVYQLGNNEKIARIAESSLAYCEQHDFEESTLRNLMKENGLPIVALLANRDKVFRLNQKLEGHHAYKINDLVYVSYKEYYDDHNELRREMSIHIDPTDLPIAETIQTMYEGFLKVAENIRDGKISCDSIYLCSWLLGGKFGKIMQGFLPELFEGVDVKVVPNQEKLSGIQTLALQVNQRVLRQYLLEGKRPEVAEVLYESEDFVERMLAKEAA